MSHFSRKAHYEEKYPGGKVVATETAVDAFCAGGKHRVAERKSGAGIWVDESEAHGCVDRACLAPLAEDRKKHTHHGRVRSTLEAKAEDAKAAPAAEEKKK